MSDRLVPEFDEEMRHTRRTLERVPEDKFEWKPHEKSGTMGWLAGHLATIPTWASMAMSHDTLDLEPEGKPYVPPAPPSSVKQLVDTFDMNAADARRAIAGASDVDMMKSWSLLRNGQEMMTMPKAVVVRSFVLSHLIHHRAQLGVYLRLNDIPVPSIYGPSADENPMNF